MILSLRDLDLRQLPRPQVCIVGSGAAGITLACELDGSGISVLLLDPGLAKPGTSPSQSPYIGTSDEPHALPSHFRRRGYGGTTGI
jgi:choline dehydrogenase-like flavoprotein